MNYNFWNNWTIVVLTSLAAAWGFYMGLHNYLLEVDKTYISFLILFLYFLSSFMSLIFTYRKRIPKWANRFLEFVTGHLAAIGMMGTVFGLIFIIKDGIPEPQQLLIGVGTALTTTLAGLIATVLLNLQLTIMDGVTDEKEDWEPVLR